MPGCGQLATWARVLRETPHGCYLDGADVRCGRHAGVGFDFAGDDGKHYRWRSTATGGFEAVPV